MTYREIPLIESPTPSSGAAETAPPARPVYKKLPPLRLKFSNVLAFIVVVALLFALVYYTMQLSAVNAEHRAAELELSRLRSEEAEIFALSSDTGISLSEIESLALREFGMVVPASSQIVKVGNPTEDRAEVVRQRGIFESIGSFFSLNQ